MVASAIGQQQVELLCSVSYEQRDKSCYLMHTGTGCMSSQILHSTIQNRVKEKKTYGSNSG